MTFFQRIKGIKSSELLKLLLVIEKDGSSIIFGGDEDDKILAGLGGNIIHGGKGSDILIENNDVNICYAIA